MNTLSYIIITFYFLIYQGNIEKLVNNLKSNSHEVVQKSILNIFENNKKAIPFLIKNINDTTVYENLVLMNPINSNMIQSQCGRGMFFAYIVDLILARDSLITDNFLKFFPLGEHTNYMYWHGIIFNKNDVPITSKDLPIIKTIYNSWWKKNSKRTIKQLRIDYKNGLRPLSNSDYTWR